MWLRGIAAVLLLWQGALRMQAQSSQSDDLETGKVLVATRDLGDPHFARTVVLLVKYGDDGAIGLVINRRSKTSVASVLDNVKAAKDRTDPVYSGGPVGGAGVMALLRSHQAPEEATHVLGEIYLLHDQSPLEKILSSATESSLRLYQGYAGWGPGQLEDEVDLGAWYIFRGDAKFVFDTDPDSLWLRLIGEAEFKVASAGWLN